MFDLAIKNKAKKQISVTMDETTFEALIQTLWLAIGDGICEGFTEEKKQAMTEVENVLYNTFYKERDKCMK